MPRAYTSIPPKTAKNLVLPVKSLIINVVTVLPIFRTIYPSCLSGGFKQKETSAAAKALADKKETNDSFIFS
jgi:hypothetical protein